MREVPSGLSIIKEKSLSPCKHGIIEEATMLINGRPKVVSTSLDTSILSANQLPS